MKFKFLLLPLKPLFPCGWTDFHLVFIQFKELSLRHFFLILVMKAAAFHCPRHATFIANVKDFAVSYVTRSVWKTAPIWSLPVLSGKAERLGHATCTCMSKHGWGHLTLWCLTRPSGLTQYEENMFCLIFFWNVTVRNVQLIQFKLFSEKFTSDFSNDKGYSVCVMSEINRN